MSLQRPVDDPIAFNGERVIRWHQLQDDVRSLIVRISNTTLLRHSDPALTAQQDTWAIHCDDSYLFLVALLAALQSGKKIVLPSELTDPSIEELTPYIDGIITDQAHVHSVHPILMPITGQYSGEINFHFLPIDAEQHVIQFFDFKSTAKPIISSKPLNEIQDQANLIEHIWGRSVGAAWVASTISPHTLFGLIFRLIWPVTSQRVFFSATFKTPLQIEEGLKFRSTAILISQSSHLQYLPNAITLANLSEIIQLVFVTGEALPIVDNIKVQNALGRRLIEIYGTNQTGAIAYRAIDSEHLDESWTRFPHVQLAVEESNQTLLVRALKNIHEPFWLSLDDRVLLTGNERFTVLGKTVRSFPVENKTPSHGEIENRIREHKWVKQVKLRQLANASEQQPRSTTLPEVEVVVVLNSDGVSARNKLGRYEINKQLRNLLVNEIDQIFIPKKWQYVEDLPVN